MKTAAGGSLMRDGGCRVKCKKDQVIKCSFTERLHKIHLRLKPEDETRNKHTHHLLLSFFVGLYLFLISALSNRQLPLLVILGLTAVIKIDLYTTGRQRYQTWQMGQTMQLFSQSGRRDWSAVESIMIRPYWLRGLSHSFFFFRRKERRSSCFAAANTKFPPRNQFSVQPFRAFINPNMFPEVQYEVL